MSSLPLFLTAATLLVFAGGALIAYRLLHPQRVTYAVALARGVPTDPADIGLNAEETSFQLSDGSSTPGWVIHGSSPTGPLVVITHGWESSRYSGLMRAQAVAPHAHRVVVYDTRGHGDAEGRISHLGTTEASDLLHITRAATRDDHTPVILFGTSMGAGTSIVAASHAHTARERSNENGTTPNVIGVIAEAPYRTPLEPIIGRLREMRLPPYPFAWVAGWLIALRLGPFKGFDRAVHASRIPCPLLVLHGELDPISSYESGKRIAGSAPNGQLISFPGAGHGDLRAADEDRYLCSIADWFTELMLCNQNHKTHEPEQATAPK